MFKEFQLPVAVTFTTFAFVFIFLNLYFTFSLAEHQIRDFSFSKIAHDYLNVVFYLKDSLTGINFSNHFLWNFFLLWLLI